MAAARVSNLCFYFLLYQSIKYGGIVLSVFWTGKPTKGVPEVVDYAVEDRDRETENSKVCARTRDTRFIQVRVAKVANPTSCLGIKYDTLRLVLGCSDARLGTRPSFI
jgi:hypothetical protein